MAESTIQPETLQLQQASFVRIKESTYLMEEDSLVGQALQHSDYDVVEQTQSLLMFNQLLFKCDKIEYSFLVEILQ
jgi:hypothetical protein